MPRERVDKTINPVGESPSGKAAVFGTAIRRFESYLPSQLIPDIHL
jgi:hypothetical protein